MATKKASPANRPFHGYVQIDLDKAQTEDCKSRKWDAETFATSLQRLVVDGYRVTLSEDTYNECYQATITPQDVKHKHAGWHLSGRGSNVAKALKQLVYIHYEVLDTDWREYCVTAKPKIVLDD